MTWGDFKGIVAGLGYSDNDDIVEAVIHPCRPGDQLVFEVSLRHGEIRCTPATTAATAAGMPAPVSDPGPAAGSHPV